MAINNLWVVMPVYNEEEAIEPVVTEWHQKLHEAKLNFTLCILNDGSRDNTLAKLNNLAARFDNIRIINKENTGHGQSCVLGYKTAIEHGADWVFQIDSDGQCSPQHFDAFVKAADHFTFIYGRRAKRDDGLVRMAISRFVTLFTFVATGVWLRDANVPYRMMRANALKAFINQVPEDFYLANIYVTLKCNQVSKIKWLPIHFKDRSGGSPSIKTFSFVKSGIKLFRQLRDAQRQK